MLLPDDWITNDPRAAQKLRKADRAYAAALVAAKRLPLASKVDAIKEARAARDAAYAAVARGSRERSQTERRVKWTNLNLTG